MPLYVHGLPIVSLMPKRVTSTKLAPINLVSSATQKIPIHDFKLP